MLHASDSLFLPKFIAAALRVGGQVCSFGEYQKPHRIKCRSPRVRAFMPGLEFLQAMLEPWLVRLPLASHEDEAVKLHTLTKDWDILERFLKDNKKAAVHHVGVRKPPQIDPVCINLVVRYQNQALWKLCLQSPIFRQLNLVSHALVAADSNVSRTTPLGKSRNHQAKGLLGKCHVRVIFVFVDQIQGGTNDLGHDDDYTAAVEPCCHQK